MSPITYRLPVTATVTTSTMQALPITTPNVVKIARSLFDQSASTATRHASLGSIPPPSPANKDDCSRNARPNVGGAARCGNKMEMAWRILSPLQRLQGLGRLLIVRIKDESGLVFLRCAIQLP